MDSKPYASNSLLTLFYKTVLLFAQRILHGGGEIKK